MPRRLLSEDVNIQSLPRKTLLRKLNDQIKRTRLTEVSDSVCDQKHGPMNVYSVLAAVEETSDKTQGADRQQGKTIPFFISES